MSNSPSIADLLEQTNRELAGTDARVYRRVGEHLQRSGAALQNLKDQDGGVEGEKGRESEPTETKCGRNHEGGNAECDLVDEAGNEN